jgi:hypothetical protein
MQAVNGGTPTYLGIPVPFNLSTLLAIVRPPSHPASAHWLSLPLRCLTHPCMLQPSG